MFLWYFFPVHLVFARYLMPEQGFEKLLLTAHPCLRNTMLPILHSIHYCANDISKTRWYHCTEGTLASCMYSGRTWRSQWDETNVDRIIIIIPFKGHNIWTDNSKQPCRVTETHFKNLQVLEITEFIYILVDFKVYNSIWKPVTLCNCIYSTTGSS